MVKTIGNVEGEGFIISPDRKIGVYRINTFTDNTSRSENTAGWTEYNNYNISFSSNVIITNIIFKTNLSVPGSMSAALLKIQGTNLGTKYLLSSTNEIKTGNNSQAFYYLDSSIGIDEYSDNTFSTTTTSNMIVNYNIPIKITDTTITITLYMHTTTMSNTSVEIHYIDNFKEDA